MTVQIKPLWLTMSEAKLSHHLTQVLKYPAPLVMDALAFVRDHKERQRRARLKTSAIHQAWDDLLLAARSELGRVRTLKSQTVKALSESYGHTPLRDKLNALTAYDDVISDVIAKLRKVQKSDEYTPTQFAAALHKAGKLNPELSGMHWTDYVKQKDKDRIATMFNALPHQSRGKRKTPFERLVSTREHDHAKKLVVGRLCAEQGAAERAYEVTTDEEEKKRLKKQIESMQLAQYRLEILPRTHPVPKTWQDIVK